jgi:hypothetical protein
VAPLEKALRKFVRARTLERHDATRGPLVASVYHLVDRADAAGYKAALARALPALRPVRVTCSGPWPAYAFAGAWIAQGAEGSA